MPQLRRMPPLQTFAAVPGSVPTHLSADRSLASRDHDQATRTAAPAKERQPPTG